MGGKVGKKERLRVKTRAREIEQEKNKGKERRKGKARKRRKVREGSKRQNKREMKHKRTGIAVGLEGKVGEEESLKGESKGQGRKPEVEQEKNEVQERGMAIGL